MAVFPVVSISAFSIILSTGGRCNIKLIKISIVVCAGLDCPSVYVGRLRKDMKILLL